MTRIGTALAAAALVACTAGAATAQTAQWRFHNSYAPTRVESADVRAFAEDLRARTNGRFAVQVFEGNSMNLRDADALRYMQTGTPELGFIWPPFLGRDAPDIGNMLVFGAIKTADELSRVMPTLQAILSEAMRRWNIEPVGFMRLGLLDASVFCRQPVRNLEELRRVKLRVGTREQVDTFTAVGVAAQIVPQQELYAAMQTGVVDCALYPARIIHTISLQEVAKHGAFTGFPFPPAPYVIMANQARHRALPAELRTALAEAAKAVEQRSDRSAQDATAEREARARLVAGGVTWHGDFPAADQETIRNAAIQTWDKVARESGGNAPAYRQRLLTALGRGG